MASGTSGDSDLDQLSECAGPEERRRALARHFETHRSRLRFLLDLRLHPRLRGRVDPSDVIQDAYLRAEGKLDAYLANPRMPFYLWLRQMAVHALHDLHRRHLGAQMRDAEREIRRAPGDPAATSDCMAHLFVAKDRSPSEVAVVAEREAAVQRVLDQLSPADREIIALRVFERLTSVEAARVLGVRDDTARRRFSRALARFKTTYGEPVDTTEASGP